MLRKLKNLYHFFQALIAAVIFNFPSKNLVVIGVTGTDGKTTTVHMIYEILKTAGLKVSMISSVYAVIGPRQYDTGFHVTTPNAWHVQKYLRRALDGGSKYFVLETTSHGLDQNRLAFVNFNTAVITNITHEHMDYHKNWQKYASAKAKLFKSVKTSILNGDDQSFNFLKHKVSGKILTYSTKTEEDFNPKNFPLKLKIPGEYNLANALAAAAAAKNLGVTKQKILRALNNFTGVIGRMENIDLGQNFKVFIDFAHTPNGLEQSLKTLRSQLGSDSSKLIAVFGAASQRDKSKRPIMGKVADQNSDVIIITAEDPRKEKTEKIAEEIAKGIKGKKLNEGYFVVPSRAGAIEFAINLARDGDTVGIFGKGHEKSMAHGKKEYPWDEFKVTKDAIKKRIAGKKNENR